MLVARWFVKVRHSRRYEVVTELVPSLSETLYSLLGGKQVLRAKW